MNPREVDLARFADLKYIFGTFTSSFLSWLGTRPASGIQGFGLESKGRPMSHDCGTRRLRGAPLLCFHGRVELAVAGRRFSGFLTDPMADPPQAAANGPDEIPPLLPVPDSAPRPQAPATPARYS